MSFDFKNPGIFDNLVEGRSNSAGFEGNVWVDKIEREKTWSAASSGDAAIAAAIPTEIALSFALAMPPCATTTCALWISGSLGNADELTCEAQVGGLDLLMRIRYDGFSLVNCEELQFDNSSPLHHRRYTSQFLFRRGK